MKELSSVCSALGYYKLEGITALAFVITVLLELLELKVPIFFAANGYDVSLFILVVELEFLWKAFERFFCILH
jgi:hypothetical protein